MKNRKFIIVGLILSVIGFSGGVYAGNIVIDGVIKSAEQSKSYSALAANGTPQATAQMVVTEEVSIFVGIVGFGLLTHGLVNRSDDKVAPMQSKSYT
jgi:hypothetical protein